MKILFLICLLISAASSFAQQSISPLKPIKEMQVLPAVARAVKLGHASPSRTLSISVSLAPKDPKGLENLANAVSEPGNPLYGKYLTPEEVGERFGASLETVNGIVDYLKGRGLTITLKTPNRMSVLAKGSVSQVERAFHTTINDYTESSADLTTVRFYAYSSVPTLPANLAPFVVSIGGLENYTRPRPRSYPLIPSMTWRLYNTIDLLAYGLTGSGRTIGISNWDGFRLLDAGAYAYYMSIPVPLVNGFPQTVSKASIDGQNGELDAPSGEGDLDIQMAMGMAPAANIRVYDDGTGSNLVGVLSAEAAENVCDIISDSWGWSLSQPDLTAAHNQHLSLTAQGITYLVASGDNGTSLDPFAYPDFDPEVTNVGGTTVQTDSYGFRLSETGWVHSGGGWSTNSASFNVRPTWQTGAGVPSIATANKRLVPDVALLADGASSAAFYYVTSGNLVADSVGTSFSSPIFAGSLAVDEQTIIQIYNGLPPSKSGARRLGRINNLIYAQNGRPDVWYDIKSGSNGYLPNTYRSAAGPGWDFVTGWGAINFQLFVNSLVPFVSSTTPASAVHGAGARTVTINGYSFYKGAVVNWAGVNLTTTFVNSNTLTCSVPASLLKNAGSVVVTVFNSGAGGIEAVGVLFYLT